MRVESIAIQQAFSKPCLVNLISKDTHLVFSIYILQCHSLEQSGYESIVILTAGDGQFQLMGSEKGQRYAKEHSDLISDFVHYCQGNNSYYSVILVEK